MCGIRRLFSLAVLLGSATFILYYFSVHPELLAMLTNLGVRELILLVCGHLLYLVVQGLRFFVAFREFGGSAVSFPIWLKTFIVAQALNFATPQLGNVYRAVQLKAVCGLSFTQYVGGFGFFIWLSLVTTFLFGTLLILLIDPAFSPAGIPLVWVLLGLTLIGFLVPFLMTALEPMVSGRSQALDRWLSKIGQGRQAAARTFRDPSFWMTYPALTLISAAISITITWICFIALGREIGMVGLLLLYLANSVLRHVAISPGNLGVQEMMYGGGAKLLGLTLADGILASMLIRASGALTLFAVAIPLGAGTAWRELRRRRPPNA